MAEPAGEAALLQEAFRLLERARELQESAASLISRAKNEEQSLCQQAQVLESEIQRLRLSVAAAAKSGAVDAATADKLEEEIYKVKCVMSDGDVSSFLPHKGDGPDSHFVSDISLHTSFSKKSNVEWMLLSVSSSVVPGLSVISIC